MCFTRKIIALDFILSHISRHVKISGQEVFSYQEVTRYQV